MTQKSMVFITASGELKVSFTGNPTILEVAVFHQIPLNHSCGGMGSCTTCRIVVKKGLNHFGPRNELEAEHASQRSFKSEERLSCQNEAKDGIVVEIPQDE